LIGSDDGETFWTIHGEAAQTRCAINVDFSPKGGPAVLSGKYEPETLAIVWSDNNYWDQLKIPDFALSKATGSSIGGLYQDPNHLKRHSWSGFRMISDEQGDTKTDGLTLVGSDDGTHFWMLKGAKGPSDNMITIDFSPKGGPASLKGTVADGAIKWSDGNTWSKMVTTAQASTPVASMSHCDFGGYFRDPKHYKEGSFAGSRFVTSETGDKEGKDITLIGSDDGETFWTIHGEAAQTRCAINVDFSPKGGPAVLSGKYEPETLAIVWSDNNYWDQLKIPDFALSKATGSSIGGLYQDPNHLKRHSWSGFRMISDEQGDTKTDGLTLVGSDDGTHFWMLKGAKGPSDNMITIDFSPKGGPASLKGTVADGAIKWSDGNTWTKMVTNPSVLV